MLVQFTVGNYLSFREPQTLSLVASSDKHLGQNTFPVPGMKDMSLLKSVAIYGANASGKSNLIKALRFVLSFVMDSAVQRQPGKRIEVSPFKLDPLCLERPSEFELVFVSHGERYVYGFTVDTHRVHEEWLTAAKLGSRAKARSLFRRSASGKVSFGASWKGDRAKLEALTRPDALLLSVAVQFNSVTVRPVLRWFFSMMLSSPDYPEVFAPAFAAYRLRTDHQYAERMAAFAQVADLGIARLRAENVPDDLPADPMGAETPWPAYVLEALRSNDESRIPQLRTVHRRQDGEEVVFDFVTEESEGTKRLLLLAGSWFRCLTGSDRLVIDELDASLHPTLVRFLLQTLHQAPKEPQVIFTTHDPTLLDRELLRRDQVWFTEKDRDGATKLYSLWDYKVRTDENLQGRYLQGRYGAVPYVGEWSFAEEEA